MLKKINTIIVRAKILSFTILSLISPLYANNDLPNFGNETHSVISPKQEMLIGKTLFHQLQQIAIVYQDPIATAYINHLGNLLVSSTKQVDLNKFNFFVVNESKEINAFAFFGGNIGIYPQLINITETESELAAIIAHEISHITQKHAARQLLQHRKLLPVTIAGAIASSIINPNLAALILGSHAQHMLNFSREHEQEADRIGIQILTKTGFNPQAMPSIFQRLNQYNASYQKVPEYLLTHPIFESRISDAQGRVKLDNYKQFVEHLNYHLIKAIIKAEFTDDKTKLLNTIETQLKYKRYNNYTALKYTQALVLNNLHKTNRAIAILQELVNSQPENIILQLSLARVQKINNPNLAKENLANLIKIYPDYLPLIIEYAEILLNLNLPLLAKNLLQPYNKDHIYELNEHPIIYQILTACYQQLNERANSLLTQAKLLIITDQLPAAKNKISQALAVANKAEINKIKKFQKDLDEFIADIAKL